VARCPAAVQVKTVGRHERYMGIVGCLDAPDLQLNAVSLFKDIRKVSMIDWSSLLKGEKASNAGNFPPASGRYTSAAIFTPSHGN